MRKGDVLFNTEDEDWCAYIICYGKMILWNNKVGKLGNSLAFSDTLGENSVCDKDFVCRLFNCSCEEDAGVIPIFLEWMAESIDGHPDE